MEKDKTTHLDFIIDKLTNSIRNTISGDSFTTEVSRLSKSDIEQIIKTNGWNFNWKKEFDNNTREVYKLTITNNPTIIQGLLSLTIMPNYIHLDLVESAPFNLGRNKLYEGVPGNLVAFGCQVSFQKGFEGFISFTAKTKLISHYEKTLGAHNVGNQLMIINTRAARHLIDQYFKS